MTMSISLLQFWESKLFLVQYLIVSVSYLWVLYVNLNEWSWVFAFLLLVSGTWFHYLSFKRWCKLTWISLKLIIWRSTSWFSYLLRRIKSSYVSALQLSWTAIFILWNHWLLYIMLCSRDFFGAKNILFYFQTNTVYVHIEAKDLWSNT